MKASTVLTLLCWVTRSLASAHLPWKRQTCRNVPGSAGYPTTAEWSAFNASISGRLVAVVPSAEWCAQRGGCTDAEWESALFRSAIPGSMNQVNWEQGYDLSPPSTCFRNGSTVVAGCGQGDVPRYSVEAETVADIQTAVKFASTHNLRVALKATGHDYLGRSTAPNSLLIHTSKFLNLSVTDAFFVGTENMGSAATISSGVHSQILYEQAKANGKIAVGGSAATVCAAGGYLQGAGHSALAPTFGLAADNTLEFHVVVASGELLQVNSVTNLDLFYAMRGGGAGSWGVIVNATVRTFPTFNSTFGLFVLSASTNAEMAALATLHAEHIFDFDATRSTTSQYFYLTKDNATAAPILTLYTYFINQTQSQAEAIISPFLTAAQALPGVTLVSSSYTYEVINDILFQADDAAGYNLLLGSRLIPESTYRDTPQVVGTTYKQLLDD